MRRLQVQGTRKEKTRVELAARREGGGWFGHVFTRGVQYRGYSERAPLLLKTPRARRRYSSGGNRASAMASPSAFELLQSAQAALKLTRV